MSQDKTAGRGSAMNAAREAEAQADAALAAYQAMGRMGRFVFDVKFAALSSGHTWKPDYEKLERIMGEGKQP